MRLVPRIPDAFEGLIAYLCVVAGIPLAAGVSPPNPVRALLPGWLVQGWGLTLAAGGLLIAAGMWLRIRHHRHAGRIIVGLRIEQAGLVPLGAASVVYGIAIVAASGWAGMLPAGTYIAFTLACASRAAEARHSEVALRRWGTT